jgi:hypothetical protein
MTDTILRSNINFLKYVVNADTSDPRKAIEEASLYLQETVLNSTGIISFSYHNPAIASVDRTTVTGASISPEIHGIVERWCRNGEPFKTSLDLVTEPLVGPQNTEAMLADFADRMPDEYALWTSETPITQEMRRIGLTKYGLTLKGTGGSVPSYFFCSVSGRRDYRTLLDWRLSKIRGAVTAYDDFVRRVSASARAR